MLPQCWYGVAFVSLTGGRERVGEPQLDERLTAHADSLCFAVDCMKQIDREIDIHALDFTARAGSLRELETSREVFSSIVHLVQTSGAQRLSR